MNKFPAPSTASPWGMIRAPVEFAGAAANSGAEFTATLRSTCVRVSTATTTPVSGEAAKTVLPSGVTATAAGETMCASTSSWPALGEAAPYISITAFAPWSAINRFPLRSSATPNGSVSSTFWRGAQRPATLRMMDGSLVAAPATVRIVALPVSAMKSVPSGATAISLRIAKSVRARSSSAALAAPPSPIEPTVPTPAATIARSLAALAGAAFGVARTRYENTWSGRSTEVRYNSAGAAVLLAATASEYWGTTAKVRIPTFAATTAAAAPVDDTGPVADDAANELDCAGAAVLA